MKPLVSVIIPLHNAEKTVERCISSVLEQTYDNWEIICCDDCSSDNTCEKVLRFCEKDKRITLLRNEKNMKAAYSRNRCIEKAAGKYIAQIDDDDYCAKERFESQVEFLENNEKYALVGSNVYRFDENGVWGESEMIEEPEKKDFLWNSQFINPSVTFRADALKAVNGYRIEKITNRTEDYDLYMRLYTKGFKGYNMKEKLTYYYRGENSYPKCKYRYRIDEAKVRHQNFKQMGLMPKGIFYVIKPLIVGLIPMGLIERLKRRKQH